MGLKLHFTTDSYDFHKYQGKINISIDKFDIRKDKYHFHKLSRKYINQDELISFIVANLVENEKIWVGDLLQEESDIIYKKHQKVIQSLSYTFENDCNLIFSGCKNPNEVLITNGDYPVLLTKALRKEIQIETLCLLNNILNFFPMWAFKIDDTIRWPVYQKIVLKYASFLPQDTVKYKLILKKVLDEN